MTAETANPGFAQPIAWRRAVAAFGLTLLVAAAALVGFALGYQQAFAARVVPGVTVGGVSIGGLDRAAAEAALRAGLPSVTRGALLLRSPGGDQSVPFSELGRGYDYGSMLDAAMAVGHGGDLPADVAEDVRALVRGEPVAVRLSYSNTALQAAVASAAVNRDASAADAIAALGSDGRFTVRPAAAGSSIDQQTVLAEAGHVLSTPGAAPVIDLPASAVAPAITTAQAEAAIAAAQQMTARPLTLRVAGNAAFSTTIAPATLRTWVTFVATPDGGYDADDRVQPRRGPPWPSSPRRCLGPRPMPRTCWATGGSWASSRAAPAPSSTSIRRCRRSRWSSRSRPRTARRPWLSWR